VSLDLNDQRFGLSSDQREELKKRGQVPGPWWSWIWRVQHLWEVITFFCYRCLEIGARITLMALFAVRPWRSRTLQPVWLIQGAVSCIALLILVRWNVAATSSCIQSLMRVGK